MIKRLKKLERRKKNRRGGEEGQVIIEFLIVTSMILTMIFVFVQLAWGIAYGHYVHYATYMASRAYLAGGTTPQDQHAALDAKAPGRQRPISLHRACTHGG